MNTPEIDPEDYLEYEERQEVAQQGRMDDDEEEEHACNMCGGQLNFMGALGSTDWLRCRDCGWIQTPGENYDE